MNILFNERGKGGRGENNANGRGRAAKFESAMATRIGGVRKTFKNAEVRSHLRSLNRRNLARSQSTSIKSADPILIATMRDIGTRERGQTAESECEAEREGILESPMLRSAAHQRRAGWLRSVFRLSAAASRHHDDRRHSPKLTWPLPPPPHRRRRSSHHHRRHRHRSCCACRPPTISICICATTRFSPTSCRTRPHR